MDLIAKNKDTCDVKRIYDDWTNWCVEDQERCFHGKGMEDRIVDNAIEIVGTSIDLYKLLDTDDTCYNSAEQVAEVGRLAHDLGEMMSYLTGFELKWDQNGEQKHMKRSTFRTVMHEFRKRSNMKVKDIIKMDFPETYALLHAIFHELHKFMRLVDKEMDIVFRGVDHVLDEIDHDIDGFFNMLFPAPKHRKPVNTNWMMPQQQFEMPPMFEQPKDMFGGFDMNMWGMQQPQFNQWKLF